MNVRRVDRNGESHRPSRRTLVIWTAGLLAFGATVVVPLIGTPLVVTTAVVGLLSSKNRS